MSARLVERALAQLAAPGAVLAPERSGKGFGIFPHGDRRRRPIVRLSAAEVRELASCGAIEPREADAFVLTPAGVARATRETAAPGEAYAAQHRAIVDRAVMDGDGDVRVVRGHDVDRTMRRLAALRDSAGRPWLDSAEVAAAARLKADWERGEAGLVRGSDWSAPPRGSTARGAGMDGALAAHCDARRRATDALAALAAPLRSVVERVCLREEGLEALERAEAWPTRSGKLALKLALAQLAESYGSSRAGE
jgi:hypothetical protein